MALGAAVVFAVLLLSFDAPRGWRLVAFLPVWISGLGFFQARDKT
jgi:hypothetical protein